MKARRPRKTAKTKQRGAAAQATTAFVVTEVESSSQEETSQVDTSQLDIQDSKLCTSTDVASGPKSDSEQLEDITGDLSVLSGSGDVTQALELSNFVPSSDESDLEAELEDVSFFANDTAEFSTADDSSAELKRKHSASESDTNNDSIMYVDSKSSVVFEQVDMNKFKIIFLPYSRIYFHGKVCVKVVKGRVQVLGWDMFEGDIRKVFSPRGSSLLGLETFEEASEMELTPFDSPLTSSLNTLLPLQLFGGRKEGTNVLPSARAKIQAERQLDCKFMKQSMDSKVTVISPEWRQTMLDISRAAGCYENTRTIVCGGKGVGKSTFVRALTNSLLGKQMTEGGGVLVLDFDPGQSEITPPGSLAAVVVRQPLLGPGYTQQLTPDRMMFLGQVDVSQCVHQFKTSVQDLVSFSIRSYSKLPWIINTMGFNTGLGVDLLRYVLQVVSKDNHAHVVEVTSVEGRRNYPPYLWTQQLLSSLVHYPLPSVAEIKSKGSQQQQNTWGLPPKQLREISLLAYLSPALQKPDFSLLSTQPYMIKLDSLILGVVHKKVPPPCTARALLGNLVGLCHADTYVKSQALRPKDRSGPGVLLYPDVMPCFGYGVVSGVDMSAGQVYLITPEPYERLVHVNCLLLGAVELPPVLRTTGDVAGSIPYVCAGRSTNASAPVRRFYRPLASLTPSSR